MNLTQNQIPSTLLPHDGKKSTWGRFSSPFLYLKGSINLICKRKLSQIIIAMTHWNAIGCTNLLVCYFKVISGANKTHNVVYFALKSTPLSPTSYSTILCQHGGHDPLPPVTCCSIILSITISTCISSPPTLALSLSSSLLSS